MRLNLGCGPFPLKGYINLDMNPDWRMEDGLPYAGASVEAITISCVMYAVREDDYPHVFCEFYRALNPGGVVRITDGDTENPASKFYGKPYESDYGPTVLTGPRMMRNHMEDAGFTVYDMTATTTMSGDDSILQDRHGNPPDVFFIEGVK